MNMETNLSPNEDAEFASLELAGAKRTIRITSAIALAHSVYGMLVLAVGEMGVVSWIQPIVLASTALALLFTFSRGIALLLLVLYACLTLFLLIASVSNGYLELTAIPSLIILGVLLWLSIMAVRACNTIRKLKQRTAALDDENKR